MLTINGHLARRYYATINKVLPLALRTTTRTLVASNVSIHSRMFGRRTSHVATLCRSGRIALPSVRDSVESARSSTQSRTLGKSPSLSAHESSCPFPSATTLVDQLAPMLQLVGWHEYASLDESPSMELPGWRALLVVYCSWRVYSGNIWQSGIENRIKSCSPCIGFDATLLRGLCRSTTPRGLLRGRLCKDTIRGAAKANGRSFRRSLDSRQ